MGNADFKTQENILRAGKEEFLKKGFLEASLRNIVKNAGVTTGAFYGYYKSKEELFDALVNQQEKYFMDTFVGAQKEFAELPPEEQPDNMSEISWMCMKHLLEYMYENADVFKLILMHSEGTKHAGFVHSLAEIEIDATHDFFDVLHRLGHKTGNIDRHLEHMIVSGYFSAFFETIIHDMPLEQAKTYISELKDFYTAGWYKIMEL